ncbi:MAG: YybH family protein [Terriglobales bacterium]
MPRTLKMLLPLVIAALPLTAQTAAAAPIRAVLTAQTAAWNRADVPGFMQGYWRSPQLEFVGGGGVTRGWNATLTHYQKSYPNRSAMGQLTFSQLEIVPLCGDAALVTGRYDLARASDHPHGFFTLVFRHFREGWRIISDHTTAASK